jgi:hypothetical protein
MRYEEVSKLLITFIFCVFCLSNTFAKNDSQVTVTETKTGVSVRSKQEIKKYSLNIIWKIIK